jgi:hexosaminidase
MSLDVRAAQHDIIPCPLNVLRQNSGAFSLTPETTIESDAFSLNVANYLSEILHIQKGSQSTAGRIVFSFDSSRPQLGEEGYTLSVTPNVVEIRARHRTGLFYACQTLLQLLQNDQTLVCTEIEDRPRFCWRGLMLDVARYFCSIEFIKRTIDLMALYKMNRLHLHLTDAQAWRLEIKKYPLLAKPLHKRSPMVPDDRHYSQEDIRHIVSYAGERQVMVIPEIEFPCHSDAVLVAYPELLCSTHASHAGGLDHMEYCPGSEKVFEFVDGVLSEATTLFDAPFIHIGGDEYYGTAWEKCPECRRRIEVEGLDRENSNVLETLFSHCQGSHKKYLLYRYMMRRIARMVVDRDRIPILWDDLSWQGNFPEKGMIVQWHYKGLHDWMERVTTPCNPASQAALAGHDAIVASSSHLYFDYFDGGRLMKRLYEFEPIPEELSNGSASHIVGPHVCMWECPQNKMEAMIFPRLLAVAEMGWTDKSLRTWADFSVRLESHIPQLNRLGIEYASLPNIEDVAANGLSGKWEFTAATERMKDWLINECVSKPGIYEVRFEFIYGKDSTTITKALWTNDGHEISLEPLDSEADDCKIYRFDISDLKTESLYGIRLYFKNDGKVDFCIKGNVRFIHSISEEKKICR